MENIDSGRQRTERQVNNNIGTKNRETDKRETKN